MVALGTGLLISRITNPTSRVLLSDEMIAPDGGILPQRSTDPARFTAGYAGGEYVIHVNAPFSQGEALLPGEFADSSIAIDGALLNAAADQFLQLACRSQGQGSQYRFGFRPANGEFWITRWTEGAQVATLTSTDGSKTATDMGAKVNPHSQTNHLELACEKNVISAIVNGTIVASVSDGTFQRGQVWIAAGETPLAARTNTSTGGVHPEVPTEGHF